MGRNKSELIIAVLALIIAMCALLFGDNLLERMFGISFFSSTQTVTNPVQEVTSEEANNDSLAFEVHVEPLSEVPQIQIESLEPTGSVNPTTQQKTIQVGPYWGYRSDLGTNSLMLNILSVGSTCIEQVEVIVDGHSLTATAITDPNDAHHIQEYYEDFEGTGGTSCNYSIDNQAIIPKQYFSVPAATYGNNIPAAPPYEWCYQAQDKTWRPCN